MAFQNITTASGRARLKPRGDPYFEKITKGQHVGFRKLEDGGSWLARFTIGTTKKYYQIGTAAQYPEYADALKPALSWFASVQDDDAPDAARTVQQAVEEYCRRLRLRKSEDSSLRNLQMAQRHIFPAIGKVLLSKLTTR